jgi:multisubunit Na+/H+ antiporter MnhB subunit
MSALSESLSFITPETAKTLSYTGGAAFILMTLLFILVVFVGGSKTKVRLMIFAGLALCGVLAVICSLLYLWHSHARV